VTGEITQNLLQAQTAVAAGGIKLSVGGSRWAKVGGYLKQAERKGISLNFVEQNGLSLPGFNIMHFCSTIGRC
jgi:hypothetical protein